LVTAPREAAVRLAAQELIEVGRRHGWSTSELAGLVEELS
jgi:hypothetical protein